MERASRVRLPWLTAVCAFLVMTLGGDYLFTHAVIYRSDSFEAGKVAHLIGEKGAEIPIFGSSKARHDYVPSLISPLAFNYGMDSASFEVVDALLDVELAKPKCGPIIIDVFQSAFHDLGDISKFAPFAGRPEFRLALDEQHAMEWRFLVPGLRYFGYYDWYLKDYLNERLGLTRKVVRGYTVSTNGTDFSRQDLEAAVQKRLAEGFTYTEDRSQLAQFLRRVRSAPNRRFIIVFSPLHSSCFRVFRNYSGFQKYVADLRAEPNATVLDWSQMPLKDEDFTDTTHLSFQGARKFSTRLHDEIKDLLNTSCSAAPTQRSAL